MSGNFKPVKAWCIAKGGKLLPNEVYTEKDIVLCKGESLIRVVISPDERKLGKIK